MANQGAQPRSEGVATAAVEPREFGRRDGVTALGVPLKLEAILVAHSQRPVLVVTGATAGA